VNTGQILREIVERKKDDIAFIFNNKEYTYKCLEEQVNKFANVFKDLGIEKGAKVAIYLPSWPEYIFAYFAIFKMGAVAVPLDHRLKLEEIFPLINHCQAEFLITHPSKNFNAGFIKKNVPLIKKIMLTSGNFENCVSLPEELKNSSSDFPVSEIGENDLAAIFYTSGTTGIPKGVMWNYRHLDSPIETFKYFKLFGENGDTCVCPLPLSHNGGIVGLFLILFGVKLILMEKYHPFELLNNLQNYKITFMFLVPSMFVGMLHLKEFEKAHLPNLKWGAVFGAPSSPELLERFRKVCPETKLFTGYGLTETAAPNVMPPLNKIKPGSVGKVVPWVEIKIIDEKGNEIEVGEIIMKGWPITPGYYNQLEVTAEVIKDGWLYTGDIGKFDEDGYLYIVGRKKEIIIVGGLNVFAPEVEGVIFKHQKVKEIAVIGVPDKLRGETIKAVIVPKEGEEITEFEVKNFCRKHLAGYKVPTIIEFRKELPKTGSGKIKKEELK